MRRPPAVARVLERVTTTVRDHEMVLPGQTVLVSVSGGPDSLCLLESLVALRRLFRVSLEIFHLDHGLREDSAADAAYVKRLATRHSLALHLRAADDAPAKGESVEAWARAQRIAAAAAVRREIGAVRIAEGHTLDDQAETLLIALMRGGGLEALGGIEPVLGPEVQPLIDVTREEVEAFCRALHLRPRRDPMNLDTRFLRNAVRLKVLPAMERASGRELKASIARTADLLRADERELRRQAFAAAEETLEETPEGVDLAAAALLSLAEPIAGRVIRRATYLLGVVPTAEGIAAVLDLAAGRPGRRRDLVDGVKGERGRVYVHLTRPSPE
jgi:tRNA(Ile)-lysidine synthase